MTCVPACMLRFGLYGYGSTVSWNFGLPSPSFFAASKLAPFWCPLAWSACTCVFACVFACVCVGVYVRVCVCVLTIALRSMVAMVRVIVGPCERGISEEKKLGGGGRGGETSGGSSLLGTLPFRGCALDYFSSPKGLYIYIYNACCCAFACVFA